MLTQRMCFRPISGSQLWRPSYGVTVMASQLWRRLIDSIQRFHASNSAEPRPGQLRFSI